MFKRIRKAWELSNMKDIQEADTITVSKSGKEKTFIVATATEPIGEGNAVFLGEGTTEEYEDMLKEDKGEKPWYDRIKRML